MTLYFLFLFLVPFQEHPILGAQLFHVGTFPITPIKLVGVPLLAAALLLPRPRDAAPRPSATVLLLFTAFALFQLLGTTLSYVAFPGDDASTLVSFAILIVATSLLVSTQRRLRMTVRVLVLVESFAATWLYKQYYIYHWIRPIGPSSDPNYEALSLVMTVPLAVWLSLYDDWALGRWIGRACAPFLAFAVFVAQSRGGLLALVVMAGIAWLNSGHKFRLTMGLMAGTGVLFALSPGQFIQRIQQIPLRGQAQTGGGAEVSALARLELARSGLHMMEAHPVFGIGLDQFKSVEFLYNPKLAIVEPNAHIAHNTYVQLGAEGGIPTLALYLAIMGVTLLTCRRARKLSGVPKDIAGLALSFQIGLIGIMVAQFFLTAEYVKEVWVFISLTPNMYAVCVHAAALSRKTVAAQSEPAGPILLRPRLRTG